MKSPAFQFYPADFLVGVMGLSEEEVGAYIKMLAVQWLKGPLPSCPKEIKKLVGLGKKPSDFLMEKFPIGNCGKRKNERLEKEREKQLAFRESRAENAKKRWNKESTSNARASRSTCKKDALQSSSSSSEKNRDAGASQEVVDLWNSITILPSVRAVTTKRKTAIASRLKDGFFRDNWKSAMIQIPQQPFLLGENNRGWKADFDWFLQPDTVAKITEGKYSQGKKPSQEFKASDVGI